MCCVYDFKAYDDFWAQVEYEQEVQFLEDACNDWDQEYKKALGF